MTFESPVFMVFLALFLIGYYALLDFRKSRLLFLFLGSLLFCFSSGIRNGVLLLASILFNFAISSCIRKAKDHQRAKLVILFAGIAVDAGTLLAFRYFQNYGQNNFPLGLSFYTFTSIAFLIEIYFQRVEHPGLLRLAASISFFPTLTAGPLIIPNEFAGQLKKPLAVLDWEVVVPALTRIANGLLKKSLADMSLIIMRYDPVMDLAHGRFIWIQAIATAARFYADFSGYSDIAIGTAGLLGLSVPENFRLPYFSLSISDFWRRWHMTLGHWIRIYVYQPMIFSEFLEPVRFVPKYGRGLFRNRHYFGLIISMMIFGIWHGIKINFLAWGLYHGILLCLDSFAGKILERCNHWLRRGMTFFLVLNGFVIFTADDFPSMMHKFRSMYTASVFANPGVGFWHLVAAMLLLFIPHGLDFFLQRISFFRNRYWAGWAFASLLLALQYLSSGTAQEFIYSKF